MIWGAGANNLIWRRVLLLTVIIVGIEYFIRSNITNAFLVLVNPYRWWLEGHVITAEAASFIFDLGHLVLFGVFAFFVVGWLLRYFANQSEKNKHNEPLRADDVLNMLTEDE